MSERESADESADESVGKGEDTGKRSKRRRRSKRREHPRVPPKIAHGLLLIDKPQGITSFDVIRELRRATGVKKMGHTGTLDPMATGLLVICLGEATKLVPHLTADDKEYEAEVTFGVTTNTYDAEGDVVQRAERADITLSQELVSATLESFQGQQKQRPPAFSAIKVNGERLYERARRGEEVEVPVRDVTFHELELIHFTLNPLPEESGEGSSRYPTAQARVKCSKGTYIRSLAADWGERLGCGAHLSALRRTQAGKLSLSDAHQLSEINTESLEALLVPLAESLPQAPIIHLSDPEVIAVRQGKLISCQPHELEPSPIYRGLSSDGSLVALLEPTEDHLKVIRGFKS